MKVVAVAMLFLIISTPPLRAAPRLVSDAAEYDFEQALSGTEVTHTFEVRNDGDEMLEIREVKTSCGCTVAELAKKTLAPDESVLLKAQLSLEGKRGVQQATITVKSNDPEQPELKLRLRGEAIEPVTIEPGRLFFGQVQPGETRRRRALIRVNAEGNLAIHEVKVLAANEARRTTTGAGGIAKAAADVTGERMWSGSVEVIEPGREFELTVRFEAGESLRRVDGEVRLHTDSSQHPTLTVPVSAVVASDLSVTPETISVSDGAEPVTRYLLIALRRDGKPVPFEIESIEAPTVKGREVDIEHRPLGQGAYHIRLAGVVGAAELDGEALVIETDLEDYPRVRVPFEVDGSERAAMENGAQP